MRAKHVRGMSALVITTAIAIGCATATDDHGSSEGALTKSSGGASTTSSGGASTTSSGGAGTTSSGGASTTSSGGASTSSGDPMPTHDAG